MKLDNEGRKERVKRFRMDPNVQEIEISCWGTGMQKEKEKLKKDILLSLGGQALVIKLKYRLIKVFGVLKEIIF